MLEFLLFALFSQPSEDFFQKNGVNSLPQIEVLSPSNVPQKDPSRIAPKLLENPRTAILATDLESGKTLLESKSSRAQPIASLTKLMTALVILENHDLDEDVIIPREATTVQGSKIDIYEYEKMSVRTLLEALLISSANDAAVSLAIHHAGSEAEFVRKMNTRATELDLHSAEFFNSTGLDMMKTLPEPGFKEPRNPGSLETPPEPYGNTMSANDVMRLARILLREDFVRETVSKDHFYGTSSDEKFFHEKPSTNQLLGTFLNLKGMKTGFTHLAGECFVALGETADGHEVMTVILGSEDRFGETKTLLSWIYDAFTWR